MSPQLCACIFFVNTRQLRNSLFGTNPRLTARLLSRTGNFFASNRDPLRWACGWIRRKLKMYISLLGTCRSKLYIACGDFFQKVTVRSFCCGISAPSAAASRRLRSETPACGRVSFPNHNHFVSTGS